MGLVSFDDLMSHYGHCIVVARYGKHGKPPWFNVAIECEDCNEVLVDYESKQIKRPKDQRIVYECRGCGSLGSQVCSPDCPIQRLPDRHVKAQMNKAARAIRAACKHTIGEGKRRKKR